MRSMVGHYFSLGFGLTAIGAGLLVGNGGQPWLAACAGVLTALVSEITCWIWREVNPPPRKRRAGVGSTQMRGGGQQTRGSTQRARHVPVHAALVSDLGPTEVVLVRCGCGRAEVLTVEKLLTTGVPPERKLTDLGREMRCRRCETSGCAIVSVTRGKLVQ